MRIKSKVAASDDSGPGSSAVSALDSDSAPEVDVGGGPGEPPDEDSEKPSPHNILTSLEHVQDISELCDLFPEYDFNKRWEVTQQLPGGPKRVIARIHCVGGESFRADCQCVHEGSSAKGPCKMIIRLHGKFEASQALLVKWAIFGTACRADTHQNVARQQMKLWREAAGRPGQASAGASASAAAAAAI